MNKNKIKIIQLTLKYERQKKVREDNQIMKYSDKNLFSI